jgi:DNA-binding transcriptional MerR regulator
MNLPRGGASTDELVGIKVVAARTGLTERTIVYWQEQGLFEASAQTTPRAGRVRTHAGHRRYSPADVARVELIRDWQATFGLSLAAIRRLLAGDAGGAAPSAPGLRLRRLRVRNSAGRAHYRWRAVFNRTSTAALRWA